MTKFVIIAGVPKFEPSNPGDWVAYAEELQQFRAVENYWFEAIRQAYGMDYAHDWEPNHRPRRSAALFTSRTVEELAAMKIKAVPFAEAMKKVTT